jgi:hypothetical protein
LIISTVTKYTKREGNEMSRNWHSQSSKKLHQARISPDLKRSIRTLAIIRDTSISAITEQAVQMYINKNREIIRDYHLTLASGGK